MNGKQYIDDLLKSKGFQILNNTSECIDYVSKAILTTANSVVIINGVRKVIPGKRGQIMLMFKISDAEDITTGDKYISIHSHAFFNDSNLGNVCFGQIHDVVPDDDINGIYDAISLFLSIFNMR